MKKLMFIIGLLLFVIVVQCVKIKTIENVIQGCHETIIEQQQEIRTLADVE